MIKLTCIGILGKDAEVKEFGNRTVINLSIAVNKDFKNHDGVKVEKTEWIHGVIWRDTDKSAKIADLFKKGKKLHLEGDPSIETYLSKEGEAKGALTLTIHEFELL